MFASDEIDWEGGGSGDPQAMKAKRRVVTHGKAPGPGGAKPGSRPKRTPTIRTIRSAIVEPKPARPAGPGGPAGGAGGRDAHGGAAAGPGSNSPIVALGSPAIAPVGAGGRGGERAGADPSVDLSVDLGRGLVLANPILVASGTFGYGVEYGDVVDVERLGAICCKGTTLKPRIGNLTPRVTETPGGMLNSIGLQNPGVDAVIEKYAATWAGWKVPVIVNVAGESVERLRRGRPPARRRARASPGIELNISCPNVGKGGLQFAIDAGRRRRGHGGRPPGDRPAAPRQALAERRRRPPDRPGDRGGRRRRADRDQHAVAGSPSRRRAASRCSATSTAGCPGPAIKPVALRIVYEVAQVVDIPIVAIGGVTELADVLDFLAVGAVAVQVGTAIFADPTLPVRLVDELRGGVPPARSRLVRAAHRHGAAAAGPGAPSAKGVEYRP